MNGDYIDYTYKIWGVLVTIAFASQVLLNHKMVKAMKGLRLEINNIKYTMPYRCDCKFQEHCSLARQQLQVVSRMDENYKGVKNCEFYKLLDNNEEFYLNDLDYEKYNMR